MAIALHNIPEGIAIAVPALEARPESPWTAFSLASLSGLAEPVGAAAALAMMEQADASSFDVANIQNILAFVAGIMVTVAIWELVPEAIRHSENDRWPLVLGTVTGMSVMLATERYL